ncbi:MAG: HD domain-containing protein [Nitrospirae bacterium]|nr:HD domain-containing protein [Nitrospirota bacterium]
MIRRLSLETKILAVIVCCVIMGVAVLSYLVVKRETALIHSEHEKNARVLSTSIITALKDNMLTGQTEETVRLINKLARIDGVSGLTLIDPDGKPAFGLAPPAMEISAEDMRKILDGEDIRALSSGQMHFITPLLNEEVCRPCHRDSRKVRGAVITGIHTGEIERHSKDLLRRMAAFAVTVSAVLSAVLILFTRRMLLAPIVGLIGSTREIAKGNFVLFKPRGTFCFNVRRCGKTGCPSFNNNEVPCWLQEGCYCDWGGADTLHHEEKIRICGKCQVYRRLRGDEMAQLQDNFNLMSITLRKNDTALSAHIREIEDLNLELKQSNTKLSRLLEASRLTSSTLEPGLTLSSALEIILSVTHMKAGVIMLLEEDISRKCYEYFDCDSYNCPAYKSDVSCWRLFGTMCHGGPRDCPHDLTSAECWNTKGVHTHYTASVTLADKVRSCTACQFFSGVELVLKTSSGLPSAGACARINLDGSSLHKTLFKNRITVSHSPEDLFNVPFGAVTELTIPLRIKEKVIGVAHLASDLQVIYNSEDLAFINFLSDTISSGISNSILFDDIETSYFQTVMTLANVIEAKDEYTRGHGERVAEICMRLADALDLSRQEKEYLKCAAILHDIGKIALRGEIIRKNGCLDSSEYDEVCLHPERGARILEPIHFIKPLIAAIRHHHERFDGKGYPDGLRGKKIPFKARIVCVADAWDAMMSFRPYRDALSPERAKEEIKNNSGSQFDPEIVDVFLKVF